MGQCSTLPTDVRNNSGGGGSSTGGDQYAPTSRFKRHASSSGYHHQQQQPSQHQPQQRDDDENGTRNGSRDVVMTDASSGSRRKQTNQGNNVDELVSVVKNSINAFECQNYEQQKGGGRNAGASSSRSRMRTSSQTSEAREGPSVAQPPDGAERKRCYRLNLELGPEELASFDPKTGQTVFGPHVYEPPPHHLPPNKKQVRKSHSWHSATAGMTALQVSNSEDNSTGSSAKSATAVAISTAQIFRGITVDRKGTILTQNARASRSAKNRGESKNKQGEKSRQAAKIDKAKDLVDDAVNGTSATDGEPSKMVSLFIMGEYDDMKHLVRDGSKKLRDASNLPDDALLSINRQRTSSSSSYAGGIHGTPPLGAANRKRISPYGPGSSNLSPNQAVGGSKSRHSRTQSGAPPPPQSAPPKLKAHPRDRGGPPRRPGGDGGGGEGGDHVQCNDIPIFGPRDSDWSDALNFSNKFHSIWNCGATGGGSSTGTLSPTNPASPSHKTMPSYVASGGRGTSSLPMTREGRNESAYRGGADRSERVDAMGNVVA